MNGDERKEFLLGAAWWAVIFLIAYLIFKYLARLLMPLVLAFLFAALARPMAKLLSRETRLVRRGGETVLVRRRVRLNRAAAGVISVTALLLPLGAGVLALLGRALEAAAALFNGLPAFYERSFVPGVQRLYDRALAMGECLDAPVRELLSAAVPELLADTGRALSAFSGRALSGLTALAAGLPGLALNVTIFVIAAVFTAADYDRISVFVRRNLPERALRFAVNVRISLTETARRFLRSYFLIFCVTVGEIALGLALIGVERAGLIALGVGVLDAFPVVGSGMALLPWAAVSLITGETARGAALLTLYAAVTVIRQIIEPRILGKRVGLRPVVTLLCMYAGARLFGGVGLVCLPVTAAILTDLNTNGVIRLFDLGLPPGEEGSAAAEGM